MRLVVFETNAGCLLVQRQLHRIECKFLGRVQGVGFRARVEAIARGFNVVGTVWNAVDGSVGLIAEGAEEQLLRFLQEIQTQMDRNIVSHQASWFDISELSCSGFSIGADRF